MTDAEFIYARWHEAARSRDVPALLALYAEDAELESPLVPVILNRASGVLRGHAQIREFLEEGTRRRRRRPRAGIQPGLCLDGARSLADHAGPRLLRRERL